MLKVLIVDDDEDIGYMIGDFLETQGYDCTLVQDVKQARSHLKSEEFQLILSDYRMPGESGLDLLHYASANHPDAPMIIMSGYDDPEVQERALEMGAYAYILKPFRIGELLDCIMRALLGRPARRGVAGSSFADSRLPSFPEL